MSELKAFQVTVASNEYVGLSIEGEALAHSEIEVEKLMQSLDVDDLWYGEYGMGAEEQADEEGLDYTGSSWEIMEVALDELYELEPDEVTVPTLVFNGETISL